MDYLAHAVGLIVTAMTVVLAALSPLAIVRAPVYRLWKPAVAATEWGHWLALFALLLAAAGLVGLAPAWTIALSAVAALLFLTPLVRAVRVARRLPVSCDLAFGPASSPSRILPGETGRSQTGSVPKSRYDARCPFVPLRIRHLAHVPIPPVNRETMVYREVDGVGLHLDLYLPRDASCGGSEPVASPGTVLVVHGGSWCSGSRTQLTGMNRWMASRGWAVAALDYRLAPRFRFPAPLEDIVAAIDYLGRIGPERGFDGTRVVLLGRSSGGHLSLAAAYRYPDRVRGVAAFYAPTDLVWSWRRPAPRRLLDSNGVIEQFLGATPDGALDVFEAASPILDVTRNSPPTLLIHGAKDELVSPLQSTRLARVLDEAGAPHLHLELPWGCHGLDANLAGPSGQISTWLVERFLDFCNREQGSR